jgi:hypothetical protein
VPLDGGPAERMCDGCAVTWAPDGRLLYVARSSARKTLAIPLPIGEMLPKLPPMGHVDDPALFTGSRLIDAYPVAPGPVPSVYAYVKTTTHRNLYRIALQ